MTVWVYWGEYNGMLMKGRYGNGRIALFVAEPGYPDSEMIGVATVNLPDIELADDEVAIKTYSENEGVEKALEPTGILKEKVREVQTGYVTVPIYKIDMKVLDRVTEL